MREVERLLAFRRQLYQAMRVGAAAPRAWGLNMGGTWGAAPGEQPTTLAAAATWSLSPRLSLFVYTALPRVSPAALPQEAEEAEEARQAKEEARQAAIVEAERQRLLREAAAQLPRDCLPKGVFKVRG